MRSTKDYHDVQIVAELITRVFCDTRPRRKVDAVYIFGESRDNEDSVLETGISLWKSGRVKRVCIPSQSSFWVTRHKEWKKRLMSGGVPESRILGIPLSHDFPPSTDAEASGLADNAKLHNWKNIFITATPLHHLRAFISTISALDRKKIKLNIFNYAGSAQSWNKNIVHSQDIQRGTRRKLIYKELEKIEHYFQKGDLISPRKTLKYLDNRGESKGQ